MRESHSGYRRKVNLNGCHIRHTFDKFYFKWLTRSDDTFQRKENVLFSSKTVFAAFASDTNVKKKLFNDIGMTGMVI